MCRALKKPLKQFGAQLSPFVAALAREKYVVRMLLVLRAEKRPEKIDGEAADRANSFTESHSRRARSGRRIGLSPYGDHRPARGFTLIELLLAMLIMAMVVGALGALTKAVQLANEYGEGYGIATQHARVTIERINRAVAGAYAKSTYPGVWVTQDTIGQWTYPDTLVVWSPTGSPANPAGPPLVQELLIFCPDSSASGNLIQLNVPGDTRTVPTTSSSTLKPFIDSLKTSSAANKVTLTNLLRMAIPSSTTTTNPPRGVVRFVVNHTPTISSWNSYLAGTLPWTSLKWAQGMHSQITGVRQVRVRYELQLIPGETWVAGNPAGEMTIPFLGSASFCYGMP